MTSAEQAGSSKPPRLIQIANLFARHSNFTLGGGSATIAVLHGELLEKRRWVTNDQFALSFALGRVTPGTNLLAFCTGVGWLLRGLPGAVVALLAASIPCALIVIAATAFFSEWQGSTWAQAAIKGAVAAAVAVTVKTCWTIAHPHFKPGLKVRVVVIATAAFTLNVGLGLAPIQVLVLAALIGAALPPARP